MMLLLVLRPRQNGQDSIAGSSASDETNAALTLLFNNGRTDSRADYFLAVIICIGSRKRTTFHYTDTLHTSCSE